MKEAEKERGDDGEGGNRLGGGRGAKQFQWVSEVEDSVSLHAFLRSKKIDRYLSV